jgi:hypothetical protein
MSLVFSHPCIEWLQLQIWQLSTLWIVMVRASNKWFKTKSNLCSQHLTVSIWPKGWFTRPNCCYLCGNMQYMYGCCNLEQNFIFELNKWPFTYDLGDSLLFPPLVSFVEACAMIMDIELLIDVVLAKMSNWRLHTLCLTSPKWKSRSSLALNGSRAHDWTFDDHWWVNHKSIR